MDNWERLASPTSWFDIVGPLTRAAADSHRVFCQCGLHAGAQVSSDSALTWLRSGHFRGCTRPSTFKICQEDRDLTGITKLHAPTIH